jgi:purine-nucleoside phosphorylase
MQISIQLDRVTNTVAVQGQHVGISNMGLRMYELVKNYGLRSLTPCYVKI